MHRFVTVMTALVVALGMGFMLSGPAQSAPGASTSASHVARKAKRARPITMHFKVTNGGRKFKFSGKVKTCGKHHKIRLQRKGKLHGHWHQYRKGRTNRYGHYSFKHLHRVGYYRATAPSTKVCKRGYSAVHHIYRA